MSGERAHPVVSVHSPCTESEGLSAHACMQTSTMTHMRGSRLDCSVLLVWKACQAAVPSAHLATAAMRPSALWPPITIGYSSSAPPLLSTREMLRTGKGRQACQTHTPPARYTPDPRTPEAVHFRQGLAQGGQRGRRQGLALDDRGGQAQAELLQRGAVLRGHYSWQEQGITCQCCTQLLLASLTQGGCWITCCSTVTAPGGAGTNPRRLLRL